MDATMAYLTLEEAMALSPEKFKGKYAIIGHFVHATDTIPMDVLRDHIIGIENGKIIFLDSSKNKDKLLKEFNIPTTSVMTLKDWQFIMPGFVDTHIHASQYPNAGKGMNHGLLDWLLKYTFPVEAKFNDLDFALTSYRLVVGRVLQYGTTTACYFATIHTDSTLVLCDVIAEFGQRALVGKVNMNMNSPDYYIEKTDHSLEETERFINLVLQRKYPLITPCITPRFSVACSTSLMTKLGDLAQKYKLPVQTHISETRDECKLVGELFPSAKHYADTYEKANLLTEKTVLAHGIYLSQDELDVIKERNCAISHCPNSNLSIRSGLMDVRKVMEKGIKLGLGTDLSGGYHPSMLDALRTAVHTSNVHAIQSENGYKPISYKEVFSIATLGGSKALGLEDTIGNFEVGKEFDALLIDPKSFHSVMDVFEHDTLECTVEKFLHVGDDRNIIMVLVAGHPVRHCIDKDLKDEQ